MGGKKVGENKWGDFAISGRMAGISRKKIAGDVSPRLFAAQSTREERSLERSPKSHGRARPRSEERQVRLTHHGNSAGLADGADLGRRGFHCAFCNASHWRFAFHVVHATDGISSALLSSSRSRGLGASRGWFRMAAVGLGFPGWKLQCCVGTGALPGV